MEELLINLMVFGGSALMAFNIYSYVMFTRHVRARGDWANETRLFYIPVGLLVLFLAGYLAVGLFGHPDLVVGGILFGGSIFVQVMLLFIQRTVDRIQEHEQLIGELTAAEEASRAKTFFLSNMSHDIRTPLNAIIGYTTLANGDGVTIEEKTTYITKIDTASRQLLDIVNDVLEMSRIESGKLELVPELTDLETIISEAADLVRLQLEAKKITFQVNCELTHRWVMCDKQLFSRVLMNLLSNAQKFTGEHGQVSLSLVEVPGDGVQAGYELRVKDTGVGMSPEFVEHLFNAFERERTSTVSKIQGTGLGMTITKSILDLMGGTIDVETEQGKGTEFCIHVAFPVGEAPEEPEELPDQEMHFQGVHALLVEDNPINREIAELVLTLEGFEVDMAENGQEAVDIVTAAKPGQYDIIFMDIQMPVMNGYDAARAIRSLPQWQTVPIVAMTANAFQDDIRTAMEAGMNAHIAKPLDVPAMMATLEEVLRGSKAD